MRDKKNHNERSDYMRTHQIADVHPNTVRLYEDWHYTSPVPRAANGYQVYTALHLNKCKLHISYLERNLSK